MENLKSFIAFVGVISFLTLCASPFVFIWGSVEIAIKVLLTGVSGILVVSLWSKIIKKSEKDIKKGES
ncbi:MAG: hypothetical protein RIR48_1345 [Bacteroidota bacterium]|jgi:hypothetical protein